MGWSIFGDTYNSAGEMGTKSVRVKMNDSIVLTYSRHWIIILNDPSFTNLRMEIYSDNPVDESIGYLIHTSTNTLTKAEIITEDNGVREIYFTWGSAKGIQLDGDNYYHFVLNGTVGALSSSSTIALKHSFPDAVYSRSATSDFRKLLVSPYDLVLVGDEL